MIFNTTEDGKGFKCDLSEAELNLAEKNPESFKNYLDYQTKLREDFLADIREQKIRELELTKQQNELKYADIKDQRDHDYRCRELDARESKEYRDFDEKRRKDAWAVIFGIGAAAINNFYSNYQIDPLPPNASLNEPKEN